MCWSCRGRIGLLKFKIKTDCTDCVFHRTVGFSPRCGRLVRFLFSSITPAHFLQQWEGELQSPGRNPPLGFLQCFSEAETLLNLSALQATAYIMLKVFTFSFRLNAVEHRLGVVRWSHTPSGNLSPDVPRGRERGARRINPVRVYLARM